MSWDASFLWQFNVLLLLMVVILAVAALSVKDLVAAAIIFGAYSFIMCLLWTEMMAVDVAFTEAAVGAGISTVLILGTALHIKRKSKD
ncbi:MAG: hydrogenase subunit MbhD domain-containing protein [Thermodesulfobacteriota bacterium]